MKSRFRDFPGISADALLVFLLVALLITVIARGDELPLASGGSHPTVAKGPLITPATGHEALRDFVLLVR